jgi:hypothetical protein
LSANCALIPGARTADDFVEAAEWLIARDPFAGVQVDNEPPLWVMPMPPIEGEQVSLFYTFDASCVWLLSIKRM